MSQDQEDIRYYKASNGLISVIQFNQPRTYNSLDDTQYFKLAHYMELADKDKESKITLLISTGNFFSSGANIKFISELPNDGKPDFSIENKKRFLNLVSIRNIYLTYLFNNHSKILVCGLNGPVIGLTASLISLCDFIYAINSKVYLLCPFTNLGLLNEGGVSGSLIQRLGLSTANEALLLARPIKSKTLLHCGFLNEVFTQFDDTKDGYIKFNNHLIEFITKEFSKLDMYSVLENKKLIRSNFNDHVDKVNYLEGIKGLNNWLSGVPPTRFTEILKKQRNHKL